MAHPNDNFANAILLTGAAGSITPIDIGSGTTSRDTSETGEDVGGAGQTLWWKWTAPAAGSVVFDTLGSPSIPAGYRGLDTILSIFTAGGGTVSTLQSAAYNDDNDLGLEYSYNSSCGTTVTAGQTIWISVDQYGANQVGTLHLTWSLNGASPPPPPPPAPVLSSVAPATGKITTPLVLTGTRMQDVTVVTLGGVACTFTHDSDTQISTTVPDTAPPGAQTVAVSSATSTPSTRPFTVLPSGVLKVHDGTSWRKVGCGSSSTVDDFTRPDANTLGPNWLETNGGTWGIKGNAATLISASTYTWAQAARECNASNGTMHVTLSNLVAGGENAGVLWRYVNAGNYWWLDLRETGDSTYDPSHNGTFAVRRTLNYSEQTIANVTLPPWQSGDIITVTMFGPEMTFYRNGNLITTVTSSELLTATKHGLFAFYDGPGDATDVQLNESTWDHFEFLPSIPGRLHAQLPDQSWIHETCAGEAGHPLKIEDPAVPGTWKTIACMASLVTVIPGIPAVPVRVTDFDTRTLATNSSYGLRATSVDVRALATNTSTRARVTAVDVRAISTNSSYGVRTTSADVRVLIQN